MIHFFVRAILTLALAWLVGLLMYLHAIPWRVQEDALKTDAIVVLTGGSLRVERGLQRLAEQRAKKLFISGVGEGVKVRELYARPGAVDLPRRIDEKDVVALGHDAADTIGNARETARWMQVQGYKSIRLITSNYHMPRGIRAFRHFMPEAEIVPEAVLPDPFQNPEWWRASDNVKLILSEYHKYLVMEAFFLWQRLEGWQS